MPNKPLPDRRRGTWKLFPEGHTMVIIVTSHAGMKSCNLVMDDTSMAAAVMEGESMSRFVRMSLTVAVFTLVAGTAYGQSVISAKAGLVHYTEGKVFVADKAVDNKIGEFTEMKAGEVLRTTEGRAEVLLTPGVFFRVSENSSFKLVNNSLEDIRIELLQGSAIIEAGEISKYDSIVVTAGAATINLEKRGLFRI